MQAGFVTLTVSTMEGSSIYDGALDAHEISKYFVCTDT